MRLERRPVRYRHLGMEKGGRAAHFKKNGRHVPLLVTVNKPRCDSADVRAGTDEQEDDEQEGLEVEKRGLRWGSGAQSSSVVSGRKTREKDGPWSLLKDGGADCVRPSARTRSSHPATWHGISRPQQFSPHAQLSHVPLSYRSSNLVLITMTLSLPHFKGE